MNIPAAPHAHPDRDRGHEPGRHGPTFWVGLAIGGAIMAFGVHGIFDELGGDNPTKLAFWVVGLDLVHDLVLAPVLVLGGLAVGALLGPHLRGPIRAALALTGLVVLFSVPLITAWGRRPGNPSTLPLNYAQSVIVVVTGIWLVTAGVLLARRWQNRNVTS